MIFLERMRGPSLIRWTVDVSKATLGKLQRDRLEHIIMGFSEHIDTILNWTEPQDMNVQHSYNCFKWSSNKMLFGQCPFSPSSVLFSHLKAAVHGCSLIVTMFLNNKWNIKLANATVILMQESSWWWQCTLGTDFPFLHSWDLSPHQYPSRHSMALHKCNEPVIVVLFIGCFIR